jgi:hypothetical protein
MCTKLHSIHIEYFLIRNVPPVLSFDIISPLGEFDPLWQCLTFSHDFVRTVFPTEQPVLYFEHRAVTHAVEKFLGHKKYDVRSLRKLLVSGDDNPVAAELAEIHSRLKSIFRLHDSCFFRVGCLDPEMRLSVTVRQAKNSQRVGVFAEVTVFEKAEGIQITSVRSSLNSLWSLRQSIRNWKRKQPEVLFVITFAPLNDDEDPREHYDETQYEDAFVEMQRITGLLREKGWVASVAPNDRNSMQEWRDQAVILGIKVFTVASFWKWRQSTQVTIKVTPTVPPAPKRAESRGSKKGFSEEGPEEEVVRMMQVLREMLEVKVWTLPEPEKSKDEKET